MKGGWVVALLALLPAIASADPGKPTKKRRPARVKRAATVALVAPSTPQAAPVAAAAGPPVFGSTVDTATRREPEPVAASEPLAAKEAPAPQGPAAGWSRVTVTLNPAPIAFGRYGGNVEVVPVAHHAIVASAYLQSFPAWMVRRLLPSNVEVGSGPSSRPGGELGYRFYTGQRGASGLFVGPSALVMPIVYPRVGQDLRAEVVSFNAYGAALDVGLQAIVDGGFTIGGGVGVMYLAYAPPPSVTPPPGVAAPTFMQPHVLPRLLLAAGWSF